MHPTLVRRFTALIAAIAATALVAVALVTSLSISASAQAAVSVGQADDTAGVYLYNAGLDSGQGFLTPPTTPCVGQPGADPTNVTIQTAVDASPPALYFLGDEEIEVTAFTLGDESTGERAGGVADTTVADVVTGLTSINDYGSVANGGDDDANFDAETGGTVTLQLHVDDAPAFILPDGVTSVGTLGSEPTDPFGNLDGAEIFIFEDAELSGYSVELFGPEGLTGPSYSLAVDDYQRNPDTASGADDTLVAIDLDSLPGFDFPYVTFITLTDDGIVVPTPGLIACPNGGAGDTSLEIDAVATRADVVSVGIGSIDIEKDTNGDQADTGSGLDIEVGAPVTWTYVVTNDGTLSLSNITVVDDQGETIDCGDGTATIATLAPGASVTCTATGTAVEGAYTNTGTASGQPLDANGNPVGGPVDDVDPSAYTGVVSAASLGDFVFNDANRNGLQEAGEAGVSDVTVTLWTADAAGAPVAPVAGVAPQVTDGTGAYLFTDLDPALSYIVQFEIPAGTSFTTQNAGDTALDSNVDPATGLTAPVTLTPGGADLTIDAGIFELASIGDFVFVDANANGLQDAGEAGVAGATVTLVPGDGSAAPAPVVSGANGAYLFENLTPDVAYSIVVDPPAGYVFTAANAGDDALDSDVIDPATGATDSVTPGPGESNLTLDAGVIAPAPAVEVEKDTNGDQADVGPGEEILVGDPVTWTYTATNTGNVPLTGVLISDDVEGAICGPFDLGVGESNTCDRASIAVAGQYRNSGEVVGQPVDPRTDLPFGDPVGDDDPSAYVGLPLASLGDFIFVDGDEDGLQTVGEPGLAGAVVNLWSVDASGAPVAVLATQTTGADGAYLFGGLVPRVPYAVQVVTPLGYVFTTADAGDDALDSDADVATGIIPAVTPAPGENNLTLDAGVIAPAPGLDVEKVTNGDQADVGPGEEILVGDPVVWTYTATNTGNLPLVGVTITDDVEGAVCGPFDLAVGASNECTLDTIAVAGEYTNTGSATGQPVDPTTGDPVGGPVEDDDPSAYVGLPLASLGDLIFVDDNEDGLQTTGEPGLAGAVVNLWSVDAAGAPDAIIETQTTGADGAYLFGDLVPRVPYAVQVLPPLGYVFTTADAGDDALDSDAVPMAVAGPLAGLIPAVTPAPGENNLTLDAGVIAPAPGLDVEKVTNGDQADVGPGEEILVGDPVAWTYTATNTGNLPLVGVTITDDVEGAVCGPFDLAVGASNECTLNTIAVAGQYTNTGSATGQPVDPTTGDPVGGPVEDDDPSAYVGLSLSSLGDFIFVDDNEDGLQTVGEPGLAGAVVNLWSVDASGAPVAVLATQTTGADGAYLFGGLVPRVPYAVQVVTPLGYVFTAADAGDDALDSDADVATGIIPAVTPAPGEQDLSLDAGVIAPAPGLDVEKVTNGDQADVGPGEEILVGDPVVWTYTATNTGNLPLVGVTITDDVEGAVCGPFDLAVGASNECTLNTIAVAGQYTNTGSATGQPVDPTTGDPVGGPVEDDDPSAYVGLPLASLGDFIFVDDNEDGLQTTGEPGLAGAVVNLWSVDASGAPVAVLATQTTGDDGAYVFADLAPNVPYIIQVIPPANGGYAATAANQGTDPALDSDADAATGLIPAVTPAPGENNMTLDAGFIPPKPDINIEKDTDGDQADEGAGEQRVVGDPVVWSYVVTNTGNVTLTDVTVTDDQVDVVTCPGGNPVAALASGDSITCSANGVVTEGAYVNTATAVGTDPTGSPVEDDDRSAYTGFVPLASLGDFIWDDVNGNGIQDDGEDGLEGVTVNLQVVAADGSVEQLATTTSGANGAYSFTDLDSDLDYRVQVIPARAGAIISPAGEGDDETTDSNVDPITGVTATIELDPAEDDITIDAGITPGRASLGDRLWFDDDSNGIQDEGEAGIAGATVNVWVVDDNGDPVEIVDTTVTGDEGDYLFTGLATTEQYRVQFVVDDIYTFTAANSGEDDVDSDADAVTGITPVIALANGDNNVTIDAGVLPLVASMNIVKTTSGTNFTVGDTVTWTYVIENDGEVDLTDVTIVDVPEGEICVIAELKVGESEECSKDGIAVAGLYENTATGTGTPNVPNPDGSAIEPPTTKDDSEYEGTEVLPTVLPTATPVPPTATPVPPTATPVPPTATPVPPTATPVPPTATPAPVVPLAVTGSSSSAIALFATGLVLLGGVALVAGRRRNLALATDGAVELR